MTTLTLHQGDAEASFEEHPIEVARRALFAAAELEDDDWAYNLRRFARVLPSRTRIARASTPEKHQRVLTERTQRLRHADELRQRKWTPLPATEREALVLRALGDERLLVRELTMRVNRALGGDLAPVVVYIERMRPLVARMWRAGLLGREPEEWQGKVRYRYFLKRDLERAYHEEGAG